MASALFFLRRARTAVFILTQKSVSAAGGPLSSARATTQFSRKTSMSTTRPGICGSRPILPLSGIVQAERLKPHPSSSSREITGRHFPIKGKALGYDLVCGNVDTAKESNILPVGGGVLDAPCGAGERKQKHPGESVPSTSSPGATTQNRPADPYSADPPDDCFSLHAGS